METYAAVRRFVIVEGNSQREASRVFGISRTTVYKMCTYSAPPGYQRTKPSAKPKLDQFIAIIYEILKADAGILDSDPADAILESFEASAIAAE